MERSWTWLDLVTAAVVGELVASGLATAAAGSNASTARADDEKFGALEGELISTYFG